jgi:hypothetical protein
VPHVWYAEGYDDGKQRWLYAASEPNLTTIGMHSLSPGPVPCNTLASPQISYPYNTHLPPGNEHGPNNQCDDGMVKHQSFSLSIEWHSPHRAWHRMS